MDTTRDWRVLFSDLDSVGLAQMAADPAVTVHCPTDRRVVCAMRADGETFHLAYASADGVWKYTFPINPDPARPETRRDGEIVHLLDCATHGRSTGRCAR